LGAIFAGFIPFAKLVTSDGKPFEAHIELGIAIPAVLVGLIGIGFATFFYRKETNIPETISKSLGGFYRAAYRKFYIDELYLFITKKIIFNYISRPVAWFDRHIVDGSMNGISYVTNQVSDRVKGFQSGQLQQYAWVFVVGALALSLAFIYLWTI
jgi:NADH-quinone oxidoreductase subunit L